MFGEDLVGKYYISNWSKTRYRVLSYDKMNDSLMLRASGSNWCEVREVKLNLLGEHYMEESKCTSS